MLVAMLRIRDLRAPGVSAASIDLGGGECVMVRGPSGAGKTLLLRAIADLDPNHGQVVLDGEARQAMPAPAWRRRVVYLPAEPGWWADLVGAHFPDWRAAAPVAAALGLPDECRDWPVSRLSTGERQRLALVRAVILEPDVLLLDEPTSGLDDEATAAVERLVGEKLGHGAGALWVSHDAAQARRLARRCLDVADGVVSEAAP